MSPVVLIIFNRPGHTAQALRAIQNARPERLFVVADGPRSGNELDVDLCAQARELLKYVDWPCVIERNYSVENLGLKKRVITGLNWVFQQVEEAVILEDDCIASLDFFGFCDNLLMRYRNDERVWCISGSNFQNGQSHGEASYYFSKYPHCWGWATWRRAWKEFSGCIPFWSQWRESSEWISFMSDPRERHYWQEIFNTSHAGEIASWAYPWTASVWKAGGLTAIPQVNLVRNIGFDDSGTHTKNGKFSLSVPTNPLPELRHPSEVVVNAKADAYVFNTVFCPAEVSQKNSFDVGAMAWLERAGRASSWLVRRLRNLANRTGNL